MKAAARIAVTVLLIVLVWRLIDGEGTLALLAGADPLLLLLALALLTAQIALSALRWTLTAQALGQKLGWRRALGEYYLGTLVNMTLPGGIVGDAGRAVRTRETNGIAAAATSVVIERLSGQGILLAVLAVGLAVWPPASPWGPMVAALGLAAAVTALIALQIGPALLRRLGRALGAVWTPGPRLWVQLGINLAIVACTIGAMAACSAAVGAPLGWAALVAVPLTLVAMLLPISVGGWGLREGAAVIVWPLAGHAAEAGLAASLSYGVLALVASLPGLAPAVRPIAPMARKAAAPPAA